MPYGLPKPASGWLNNAAQFLPSAGGVCRFAPVFREGFAKESIHGGATAPHTPSCSILRVPGMLLGIVTKTSSPSEKCFYLIHRNKVWEEQARITGEGSALVAEGAAVILACCSEAGTLFEGLGLPSAERSFRGATAPPW